MAFLDIHRATDDSYISADNPSFGGSASVKFILHRYDKINL